MPLPTTFAGVSAKGEGLFSSQKIGANYWIGYITDIYSNINGIAVDSNKNIYALVDGGFPAKYGNLIKISPTGTVLWQKEILNTIGSAGTPARVVKVGALGNIYVLASDFNNGYGNVVYKFDSSGNLIWSYNIYYIYNLYGASRPMMVLDSSENIYVTMEDGGGSNSACYVMKITNNGARATGGSGYSNYYFTAAYAPQGSVRGLFVDSSDNVYWTGSYCINRTGSPRFGYVYSYSSFIHSFDSNFNFKNGDANTNNSAAYYGVAADSNGVVWSVTQGVLTSGNYGIIAATPSGTQFSVKIWSTGQQTNQPSVSGQFTIDALNKLYFYGIGEVLPSGGLVSQSGNLSKFNYSSGSLTYSWNNYFDASTTLGGSFGVAPIADSTNNLLYVVGSTNSSGYSYPFIAVLPADGTHTGWTKTFSSISTTISYSSNPSPTNPSSTTVGTSTAATGLRDVDNTASVYSSITTSSLSFSKQTV